MKNKYINGSKDKLEKQNFKNFRHNTKEKKLIFSAPAQERMVWT